MKLNPALLTLATLLWVGWGMPSFGAIQERIRNGGFEGNVSTADWARTGNFFADSQRTNGRLSAGYAYLSNADGSPGNSISGAIIQAVDIPNGATSVIFSFWYKISSTDSDGGDSMVITLHDKNANQLARLTTLYSGNASSDYSVFSTNLTAYAGMLVAFKFEAKNDSSDATVFRIDDVSLLMDLPTPTNGNLAVFLVNQNEILAPTLETPDSPRFRLHFPDGSVRNQRGENPTVFRNLTPGEYVVEGYHTQTFLGEEFWHSASFAVVAGLESRGTIKRRFPYAADVTLFDATSGVELNPTDKVPLSSRIRAEVSVKNDVLDADIRSRVRLLVNRSKSTSSPFDVDTTFSDGQEIQRGGVRTFPFTFTLGGSGKQFYALEVESRINDDYSRTDSWEWTDAFEAVDEPTSFFGVVTDAQTGATLAGAAVSWGDSTSTANTAGRYEFTGVPCESRTLTVTLAGYQSFSETVEPVCGSSSTKDISMQRTSQIAPKDLGVVRISSGIRLTWQHTASGESGFEIKRIRTSSGSTRTFRVPSDQTTYDDTSASSGADYCYQIRSLGEPAPSQYSNEACTSTDVLDAGFTVSDFHPVTGKVVEFAARRPIAASWTYAWHTSDEQVDSNQTARFSFASPGTHLVILTVSSGFESKTSSVTVNVQASNQGAGEQGTSFSADPVNLATGNYIYEHVDLQLPGIGLPFEFKRFYNSKFSELTGLPLGYGWTHSYHIFLRDLTTNVLVTFGDGRTESYALYGSNYRPEPGVYSTLERRTDGSWQLVSKSLVALNFNSAGRLLTVSDRNGNTLSLTYAGEALDAISDTAGRDISFSSDSAGHLESLRDPLGRVVRFLYDAHTNLVGAVDTRGYTNRYQYDEEHRLTEGIAPNGITYVANVYDSELGIVLAQHDALTNWTWFHYDFASRVTRQTNALGGVSEYTFDDRLLTTNVVDERGYSLNYAYDDSRNRTLVRDRRGNKTRAYYDNHGNLTNRTDALNGVTEIVYNQRNDPIAQRDALGYWTQYHYDDRGNLVATTNALGHVVRITPAPNGLPLLLTDARGYTTTNVYDPQGLLVEVINALGYTNRMAYDAMGRRTNVVDALGRVTTFELDPADHLVRVVDALGYVTTNGFDENGRQFAVRDPRGTLTRNFFDLKDRLEFVENTLSHRTTKQYDALDRSIGTIDALGHLNRFEYDAVGNLTNVINPFGNAVRYTYDQDGNQTEVTDAESHTTVRNFDALNHLIEVVDPLGGVSRTGHDALGRIIATTNGNGHVTQLNRDALGRLTNVVDAANGTVFYDYDENGNRIKVINPNGRIWICRYDALNRLESEFDALGHETRFAYEAAGNLSSKRTPNGVTTTYAYNARNELTNIAYSTGSTVAFALDAGGLRTNMVDRLGVTSWRYDDLGRLESVTDAFGQTVDTRYDKNGNRVLLRYPGGLEVAYAWDAAGHLAAFTNWLGGITIHSYDRRGLLTNILNPNATSVATGYDALGRVSWHTNLGPAGPIATYILAYDSVGNLTNQLHQEPLVPLVPNRTNTYSYDADNRLTTVDGKIVQHDPNGNLSQLGPDTLAWDEGNRLASFSLNGVEGAAAYDGLGVRLALTENGVTRCFVVDRTSTLPQVLAETSTNGVVQAYYVYGAGLAQRITPNEVVQVYLYDPRGSTVALTDSQGSVTDAYAYLPFGEHGDHQGTTEQPFQYFGFFGQCADRSGLIFARSRYYSPGLCRFVSKDPYAGIESDPQTQNRYSYALNNSYRWFDPTGLCPRVIGSSFQDKQVHQGQYLESLKVNFLELVGMHGVKQGLKKMAGVIAARSKIDPKLLGKIAGTAAVYTEVVYTSAYTPVVDAYKDTVLHPERDNVEVMARYLTDLGLSPVFLLLDLTIAKQSTSYESAAQITTFSGEVVYDAEKVRLRAQEAMLHNPLSNWLGGQLYGAFNGTETRDRLSVVGDFLGF